MVVLAQSTAARLPLAAESVHTICCSPPYFQQRRYKTECCWPAVAFRPSPHLDAEWQVAPWFGELGWESHPLDFVGHLLLAFRECHRTLRTDGSLWIVISDKRTPDRQWHSVPEILLAALVADGWRHEDTVIWHKPAAMPGSQTNRFTRDFEKVYLLNKSTDAFFDVDAVREPLQSFDANGRRVGGGVPFGIWQNAPNEISQAHAERFVPNPAGRTRRTVWSISPKGTNLAHYACVDQSTECLTRAGWKYYNELVLGEEIASLNCASGLLSWVPLHKMHQHQVKNEIMIDAGGKNLSMLLTANHRCIVHKCLPGGMSPDDFQIVLAHELNSRHYIPVAGQWESQGQVKDIDPHFAELFGWYVTEGWRSRWAGKVHMSQSTTANPEKVDRIFYLLDKLEADYSTKERKREWRGRPANSIVFTIRGKYATKLREIAPHKELPEDVLSWSRSALGALLRAIIDGDGTVRKDDGRQSVVQKSKKFIDMVQAIAIRLGFTTLTRYRDDTKVWVCYLTNRPYRGLRGTNGVGVNIGSKRYSGIVWCPQTALGTFVARRNGSVFITGNSFPVALVTPMLRASISERGTCAQCGKPWRRVVERTKYTPPEVAPGMRNVDESRGDKTRKLSGAEYNKQVRILGERFLPSCHCHAAPTRGPVPCRRCGGTGREQIWSQNLKRAEFTARTGRTDGHFTADGTTLGERHLQDTGNSCPPCSGTGTVTGDVWPDDVDTWPVAPSIVLDPFGGTCTTGEALAKMQVGNEYPATFVGLDHSHHYLADLARERLGLKALAAWGQGIEGGDGAEALRVLAAGAEGQLVMSV